MRTTKAKKTRVCLWGLDKPVLIVPASTGIVYFNQVGGCSCLQMELEGYLVPLPDPGNEKCFNPDVWYRERTDELPPPRSWRKIGAAKLMLEHNEENYWKWRKVETCIWWEQFCEDVEYWAHQQGIGLKVIKQGEKQLEAWMWVRYRQAAHLCEGDTKPEWIRAILTWQNCD